MVRIQGESPLVVLPGPLPIAQSVPGHPPVAVGVAKNRIQPESLAVIPQGPLQVAPKDPHVCPVVQGVGVFGMDCDGPLVILHGLIDPSPAFMAQPSAIEDDGAEGPEGKLTKTLAASAVKAQRVGVVQVEKPISHSKPGHHVIGIQ